MAQSNAYQNRYIRNDIVITVADGFKLQYDSSIHHYRYKVYDHKQENLGQYFDDAVENLNKSIKFYI